MRGRAVPTCRYGISKHAGVYSAEQEVEIRADLRTWYSNLRPEKVRKHISTGCDTRARRKYRVSGWHYPRGLRHSSTNQFRFDAKVAVHINSERTATAVDVHVRSVMNRGAETGIGVHHSYFGSREFLCEDAK